jgi:hypothetical protein
LPDHSGVSPEAGFADHELQDALVSNRRGRITRESYTHMLPGELEHARDFLDKFLAERSQDRYSGIIRSKV